MESNKFYKRLINAVASGSLHNIRQQLQQMKAIDEDHARELCITTLCSLTEMGGCQSVIKEIIGSQLFVSPHNHKFLSVASTLLFNTAKISKSKEIVHWILTLMASRSRIGTVELLDFLDEDGYSALHLSVMDGDANATKILLALGSDCNKKSWTGNTALSLCMAYGYDYLVPLFINVADVDTKDSDLDTPLMFAAWNKQCAILSELIRHGADVNSVSKHGSTALWNAVYQCSPECVLNLLNHNARMDVACEGTHPLFSQNDSNSDHKEVTKLYPGHKRSLLWVAADRVSFNQDSLKVLSVLLEAGYDVTKEHWIGTGTNLLQSDHPKAFRENLPLKCLLHFFYSQPQNLKDLCRNHLRKHFKFTNMSFIEWLFKLGLTSTLKEYFTLSYIKL